MPLSFLKFPSGIDYWQSKGDEELAAALKVTLNTNVAKNIVLFLGDGMGIPTVTAARIYKGQSKSKFSGEESQLLFETFPHVALSKVGTCGSKDGFKKW